MSRVKISFDNGRAREVYARLIESYQNMSGLYRLFHHRLNPPQRVHLPRGLEGEMPELSRWLFWVNVLDYRTSADSLFRMAGRIYVEEKWAMMYGVLFPRTRFQEEFSAQTFGSNRDLFGVMIAKLTPEERIRYVLKKYQYASPNQGSSRLIRSWEMLFERYDGLPSLIFEESRSIEQFLERKKDPSFLPGHGHKLASLLALHLEEVGLIPHIEGAFPVDIHLVRLHFQLSITKGEAVTGVDVVANEIRRRATEVFYQMGISSLELSHALWGLGSRLCGRCKKTPNHTPDLIREYCPVYQFCSGPAVRDGGYRKDGKIDPTKLTKRATNEGGLF